jgi:DNA-directed RNA polymerase subunit omega
MARVTVEDCIVQLPNRFELVLLASHRARAMSAGAPLTVERDRDKNPVVALREIADHSLDVNELKDDVIRALQRHVESEDTDAGPAGLLENASGGIDPSDRPDDSPMMSEEEILQALGGANSEPQSIRRAPEEDDYLDEE